MPSRFVLGKSQALRRYHRTPGAGTGPRPGPAILAASLERARQDGQPGRLPVARRQVGCPGRSDDREDAAHFTQIYRVLLLAARAEGVDRYSLPDILDLEDGGEFSLLGQDELGTSVFENALQDQITRSAAGNVWTEQETERIILAAARVGQHVFALNVLNNCGRRCVFCGLNPAAFGARRMLLAGHIKPWKDSSPTERLDPRNGLAACPSHDVAFDTGLLTVSAGLEIQIAQSLADAVRGDQLTRQYYGRPPLLETLLLPDGAQRPARKYLDWHRENIFAA